MQNLFYQLSSLNAFTCSNMEQLEIKSKCYWPCQAESWASEMLCNTMVYLLSLLDIHTIFLLTVHIAANHTCRADQFDCVSHRADGEPACIPRNRVCDGYKDCKKGEDENATFCPPPTCRPGFFRCVKDNKCIPQNFTCDHVKDCSDGSDEPQTCSKSFFFAS